MMRWKPIIFLPLALALLIGCAGGDPSRPGFSGNARAHTRVMLGAWPSELRELSESARENVAALNALAQEAGYRLEFVLDKPPEPGHRDTPRLEYFSAYPDAVMLVTQDEAQALHAQGRGNAARAHRLHIEGEHDIAFHKDMSARAGSDFYVSDAYMSIFEALAAGQTPDVAEYFWPSPPDAYLRIYLNELP